jgi:hypothetical protein
MHRAMFLICSLTFCDMIFMVKFIFTYTTVAEMLQEERRLCLEKSKNYPCNRLWSPGGLWDVGTTTLF